MTELLGARLWLDESYDSGIEGHPGSRFVLDLQKQSHDSEKSEEDVNDPLVPPNSKHKTTDPGAGGGANHAIVDIEMALPTSVQISQSPPRALPESLSVLFVDDDFVLRKLFSRGIRKALPSWSVEEAAFGESALRIVDDKSFDLIFMDQYMTSVEKQLLGTETVRALRAKGVTCRICGLSANDMEQSFFEAGADAFMIKPFPCDKDSLTAELIRVYFG